MTALGERTLFGLLPDKESIDYLAMEGLPPECVPTDDLRTVYVWIMDYYHRGNRIGAPPADVLKNTFVPKSDKSYYDVLEDNEIFYGEDLPDATMQWAIDDLRGSYTATHAMDKIKSLSEAMAMADAKEKHEVLARGAVDLVGLAQSLESRRNRIDLSEVGADILSNYAERKALAGQGVDGLTFGMTEVDQHTGGIKPGELAVLAGYAKQGKAQPLSELVATPTGWREMGDIQEGDRVLGRSGEAIKVVAVHPQGEVDIYRVTTSDGATTRVCGDHLWMIRGSSGDRSAWHIVDTISIKSDLDSGRQRFSYIPSMSGPAVFDPCPELPVHPYLLGFLLGDSGLTTHPTFTVCSDDAIEQINRLTPLLPDGVRIHKVPSSLYGYSIVKDRTKSPNKMIAILRQLDLMGKKSEHKMVPAPYLVADPEDRLWLLRGLMDTDGWVEGRRAKRAKFASSSKQLALDVQEIVRSLGGTAPMYVKATTHLPSYVLTVNLPVGMNPFSLSRKVIDFDRGRAFDQIRNPGRRIVSVEWDGREEAQCITVDASDSLYVTRDYLVTHNSFMVARVALNEWRRGRKVALFTLENSIEMTTDRIACLALGVSQERFGKGELLPEEEETVAQWVQQTLLGSTSFHILSPDESQRSAEAIVTKARLLGVDSLIIDQLTFMTAKDTRAGRYLQIREMMHDLKNLVATGYPRLPCLLAHQINREGWGKAAKDGYYTMEHMAEGSEVERTADWVFSIFQDDAHRQASSMLFQILAARRRSMNAWDLDWDIDAGVIEVQGERQLTS
jgi:replicative DNA helicase